MRQSLPKLKDFDSKGNYVLACWEYYNNKFFGGRMQRPYIIRILKNTTNTKMMGYWKQSNRELAFAPRIFNNEAVCRSVIIHEMCHQAQHEISGERGIGGQKSHTEIWAFWMKKCGQKVSARMDAADSEKLKTKEEIAQVNKYKNTKKNIEKTSSHFTPMELKTPMGLCAKIPGGSTGNVVLGRIICKQIGGKFFFIDTETRVWNLKAESLFKVTAEERDDILSKVKDSLVLQGVNWYNAKLQKRRENASLKKDLRKRFGLY